MSLCYAVLGSVFFSITYIFIRSVLWLCCRKTLLTVDRIIIAEKCVSAVQAVLATVTGYIIAKSCQNNIMSDTHWLTNTYAWFGLPYFAYDVWAIYNTHYYMNEDVMEVSSWKGRCRHFMRHNAVMLVHHILLPLILFPMIVYFRNNQGDFFVGVLYTSEAAIPFISLRFILAQLKLKHTAAYIVSGLAMILVFFIVRILIFVFLYHQYSVYSGIPLLSVPTSIPVKCNLGCSLILLLQFYFMYLMVRGACRVFYKIYQSKKTINNSDKKS